MPPLVKQLFTAGLISDQKFSLAITKSGTSYIDFGPIENNQMANPSEL